MYFERWAPLADADAIILQLNDACSFETEKLHAVDKVREMYRNAQGARHRALHKCVYNAGLVARDVILLVLVFGEADCRCSTAAVKGMYVH